MCAKLRAVAAVLQPPGHDQGVSACAIFCAIVATWFPALVVSQLLRPFVGVYLTLSQRVWKQPSYRYHTMLWTPHTIEIDRFTCAFLSQLDLMQLSECLLRLAVSRETRGKNRKKLYTLHRRCVRLLGCRSLGRATTFCMLWSHYIMLQVCRGSRTAGLQCTRHRGTSTWYMQGIK